MICTMAKHEALAAGFDDALMLDWRGLIAEATGANIFCHRPAIVTPRQTVFWMASPGDGDEAGAGARHGRGGTTDRI